MTQRDALPRINPTPATPPYGGLSIQPLDALSIRKPRNLNG